MPRVYSRRYGHFKTHGYQKMIFIQRIDMLVYSSFSVAFLWHINSFKNILKTIYKKRKKKRENPNKLFFFSRESYTSYFWGQFLVCVYTIFPYCQILVSCTISRVSLFRPNHVYSCIWASVTAITWLTISHSLRLFYSRLLTIFVLT